MERFATARDAALKLRPDVPVYCFRPHVLREDAKNFKALFPGTTAYAVKTNGEPMVISESYKSKSSAKNCIASCKKNMPAAVAEDATA